MKKLFILMLSIFTVAAASAQVTTSGMNGTVTDEQGQPLAGATVIAVHTPSGTQYGAVTNKDGRYNLQGLRTGGPYTVTFSFVGYQGVEFPGLELQLGETLTRNAFLKDSQTLEAVVVTADGRNSSMNVNRRRYEHLQRADRADAFGKPQHERHHETHAAGFDHHVGSGDRRR